MQFQFIKYVEQNGRYAVWDNLARSSRMVETDCVDLVVTGETELVIDEVASKLDFRVIRPHHVTGTELAWPAEVTAASRVALSQIRRFIDNESALKLLEEKAQGKLHLGLACLAEYSGLSRGSRLLRSLALTPLTWNGNVRELRDQIIERLRVMSFLARPDGDAAFVCCEILLLSQTQNLRGTRPGYGVKSKDALIHALTIFEREVLDQKLDIGYRELLHQLLTEMSGLVRREQAAGAVSAFKGFDDRQDKAAKEQRSVRAAGRKPPRAAPAPAKSSTPCRDFTAGDCPRGDDCRFSHDAPPPPPPPAAKKGKATPQGGNKDIACCFEVAKAGSCPYGKDQKPPCQFSHNGNKLSEARKDPALLKKCVDQVRRITERGAYRGVAAARPASQGGDSPDERDDDPERRGVQAASRSGGGLFYLDTGGSEDHCRGVHACVGADDDGCGSDDEDFHDAEDDFDERVLLIDDAPCCEAPTAYGVVCYCELPARTLIVYRQTAQRSNFGRVFLACRRIDRGRCDFFMWADEIQQSEAENYDRYLRAVRQRSMHAGQQVEMASIDADDSMQLQVAEPVYMASGDAFDTMPLPEADRIYELSDEGTLNEVEVEAPESAVALAARYLVRVLLLGLEDMSSDEQREEAVAAAQGEMLRIAALYDDRYDVSNVRHQDVPTGYSGPDGNDTMVLLDTGDDVPSPRVVNMVKAAGDETDGDSSGDAAATAQGGAGQEGASIENQSEAGAASGVKAQEGALNEACVQVHTMLSDAITGDKTLAEWLKVPLSMAATGRGAVLEALCTELSTVVVAHLDGFWKTGPPKLDVTDTGWKVNVERVVSALLQVREASRKRERSAEGTIADGSREGWEALEGGSKHNCLRVASNNGRCGQREQCQRR